MLRILLQEILDAYAALENDEARKQMTPNLPLNFRDVVVAKHESLGNAKILIPVLPLVSRADCVRYLAAILNSQTVTLEEVKWTTRHLVRTANHAELLGEGQMAEVLAIPELISEIHHFNTTDGDMVQTARSIHALNSIFELLELNELEPEKYVFAIQSLAEEEEEAPMPTLIFRTLIQLQKHSEFFNDFITSEILPRLVKKPVLFAERRNSRAGLTEGLKFSLKISFEKMPDQRIPAKVLSMLPLHQLEDLMATFPEWKQHLKEYCQTQPLHLIPHHVRQLLH
ncbi:unnamed protein product [Amoebophrya sp. A25]|nr:unnamed protein product [Amoebophrya sp. A25]|eukprot:GSA25T00004923001.1